MTARVLIEPGVIKISKPGVDVMSATLEDLLLIAGARFGQVLYKGFVAGAGSGVPVTVNFPTLPDNPDAFVQLIVANAPTASRAIYTPGVVNSNILTTGWNITSNAVQVTFGPSSLTMVASITQQTAERSIYGYRYLIYRKPLAA